MKQKKAVMPKTVPLVALVVLGSLTALHAEDAPRRIDLAQVSIADALSNTVVVRARVADVFGDRILIEDATGRVLVEIGATTTKPATLEAGQTVEVEGRLRGRTIEAQRIALAGEERAVPQMPAPQTPPPQPQPQAATLPPSASGATPADPAALRRQAADALLTQLSRPADAATIRATLEAAGLTPAGPPVRRNKHTEILARDAAGKAWSASLDRFGRLEEIELEDYDDDSVPSRPRIDTDEVVRIASRAGYSARATVERRPEHFEVIALNAQGDIVEVHVDFAGTIYKVEWVR